MNRGGNPVIRVVMTRQIYYQQYRCDSPPARPLSRPTTSARPRGRRWARGLAEVLVARLTARSRVPGGATGRGPAPAASRAAPPPDAAAHAVTLGAARLSLNITSIRTGLWAGFEVTSLSALVDASLVSITYSARAPASISLEGRRGLIGLLLRVKRLHAASQLGDAAQRLA